MRAFTACRERAGREPVPARGGARGVLRRGGVRAISPGTTRGDDRGGPQVRIAGAPISWGVCEVPGWGHQMAPERVLAEMRDSGLAATEFGPGRVPAGRPGRADGAAEVLRARRGRRLRPGRPARPGPRPAPRRTSARSPGSATPGRWCWRPPPACDGYDERPALTEEGWRTLLANLDRLAAHAADLGVLATLHPHVGTIVEGPEEVDRVLAGSAIPLCLDTGHLLIGGTDPLELARAAAGPRRARPPQGRRRGAGRPGAVPAS